MIRARLAAGPLGCSDGFPSASPAEGQLWRAALMVTAKYQALPWVALLRLHRDGLRDLGKAGKGKDATKA